jgi:nucleoside-diphosphate-sugar epimerase
MKGAAADMFLNTVVASRNLLEAGRDAGVGRFALVSSFSVYKADALRRGAVIDETTPLEPVGIDKGNYAYVKVRQEQLFREHQQSAGFELVTLRPGVIYGPGGGAFSVRVGMSVMGRFWSLGGGAALPLTYVENCADAIAVAARRGAAGDVYNVVDDELPSCAQYLREYQANVRKLRVVRIPYPLFYLGSKLMARYSLKSKGQLPAPFTPSVVRAMFRPMQYSNTALKCLGWRQQVSTKEGMRRTFDWLREKGL